MGIEGGESNVRIMDKVTRLGTGCRFSLFTVGVKWDLKVLCGNFRKRESWELGGVGPKGNRWNC